ncbi:hypothetical protein ACMU_07905 [Actibacterium mucosum KCTC 23349]|uniref:Uncharacterized protein n=2 Tax=Actibacterium TaxID=1433986 RepID=A0A037ZL90_9RHOB|nr:hypothetical protein ACMU_07905 [Actibacterium mucosum KCTC 23349]
MPSSAVMISHTGLRRITPPQGSSTWKMALTTFFIGLALVLPKDELRPEYTQAAAEIAPHYD